MPSEKGGHGLIVRKKACPKFTQAEGNVLFCQHLLSL